MEWWRFIAPPPRCSPATSTRLPSGKFPHHLPPDCQTDLEGRGVVPGLTRSGVGEAAGFKSSRAQTSPGHVYVWM